MAAKRVRALNNKGEITWCEAEYPGAKGCNHVAHGSLQELEKAREEYFANNYGLVAYSTKKTNEVDFIKLSEILDVDLLHDEIAAEYINVREHPEDPALKVMTYSQIAQQQGRWNEATKQARGLIIRSEEESLHDALIIQRPWKKFFSLSQLGIDYDGNHTGDSWAQEWVLEDEEEGVTVSDAPPLDFQAPAEITDKLDGSLGILYRAPDGLPAFATKGSFNSEQAVYYTKMLRKNAEMLEATENLLNNHAANTYLFELLGPNNQIVIFEPEDKITMLGAVEKHSGKYLSTDEAQPYWQDKGFEVAEKMNARNLAEAVQLPDRANKEGVVVRIFNDDPNKQMMVKFKQADYVAMHRLVTGFSEKSVREVLREKTEATYGDLLRIAETEDVALLPAIHEAIDFDDNSFLKNIRETRREQFNIALLPNAKKLKAAYDIVYGLPQEDFDGDPVLAKRNFAKKIKELKTSDTDVASLFSMADFRISGKDLSTESAYPVLKKSAANFRRNSIPRED